jgi:pyruvate dehydrogenase E2 component (dihydrolipoamide acetyltransferase)
MVTKVIMPQMSLTMQFGVVSEWLKQPGDKVEKGESLCTIEGDKASVDVEAPASGVLLEIAAQIGEEFPVKKPMAYIGQPGDVIEKDGNAKEGTTSKAKSQAVEKEHSSSKAASGSRIKASPVAKRLAKEKGIDLSLVKGSGPDGLIGKEDVLAFKAGADAPPAANASGGNANELSGIKKILAERMAQSNREIPHFHLTLKCNPANANKLRKKANQENNDDPHITLTDLMVWAVSRSLKKHPLLNSSFDGNSVVSHKSNNVGVAVNTPKGLLVVVIKEADKKSLVEISKNRSSLVEKAASGRQSPDDLADCTFTISNLGMYGIESFDPIVTPGQVGILGVGALDSRLALDDKGQVLSIDELSISLGCDHRVVDGVSGAEFLSSIKEYLEDATEMFS